MFSVQAFSLDNARSKAERWLTGDYGSARELVLIEQSHDLSFSLSHSLVR